MNYEQLYKWIGYHTSTQNNKVGVYESFIHLYDVEPSLKVLQIFSPHTYALPSWKYW